MKVRFDEIDAKLRYKLMTATIIPRPVALVTTLDKDGNANAAPYSFFNGMSEDPPLVVLGLKRRDSGPKKDTARNVQAGIDRDIAIGEFVAMHVKDEIWDAEREYIDWQGNLPIARLWGTLYAPLGDQVEGPVPDPADFS